MADLSTTYLGLKLKNPVIVGSSTHTATPAKVQTLAANGVGAVVLKSIFEEQIRADVADMAAALDQEMRTEAYDYLRADFPMQIGPETYLGRIREIKAMVDMPVIASVNCVASDRWVSFARKIELAGADALELNIYDIADQDRLSSSDIENRHIELVKAITDELTIPVAVKLAPFYTSLPGFAKRLDGIGVAGLVLFNRFFQPDIDIEAMALKSAVGLSHPDDIRLPLRWTAILSGRISCDIALTGGVHSGEGIVKALLAGAAAVQVCSVLYKHDLSFVKTLVEWLATWMDAHGFDTVEAFRGRLSQEDGEVGGFERAQYVRSLVGLE